MISNSEAEQAAKQIVDSLVDAWNVHDAHAFAAIFAQSADFTNVFGMEARGREAIEQFHRPMFQTMFRDSRLVATDTRIRLIRPDVAALDVRWAMTGARDPDGNEWPDRRGLINMVVTCEQGVWSIETMHNMELAAEEMAEAQKKLQGEEHQPDTVADRRK